MPLLRRFSEEIARDFFFLPLIRLSTGFSCTKDLRYLEIPFEDDRNNCLSVLPKELFLTILSVYK